jgi:hypothetical protein
MLYAFFWVIPRRLNFVCQRFGTHCLFHLHRRVGIHLAAMVYYAYFKKYVLRFSILHVYFQSISKLKFSVVC